MTAGTTADEERLLRRAIEPATLARAAVDGYST
jgi:hypothetical protein